MRFNRVFVNSYRSDLSPLVSLISSLFLFFSFSFSILFFSRCKNRIYDLLLLAQLQNNSFPAWGVFSSVTDKWRFFFRAYRLRDEKETRKEKISRECGGTSFWTVEVRQWKWNKNERIIFAYHEESSQSYSIIRIIFNWIIFYI